MKSDLSGLADSIVEKYRNVHILITYVILE